MRVQYTVVLVVRGVGRALGKCACYARDLVHPGNSFYGSILSVDSECSNLLVNEEQNINWGFQE